MKEGRAAEPARPSFDRYRWYVMRSRSPLVKNESVSVREQRTRTATSPLPDVPLT